MDRRTADQLIKNYKDEVAKLGDTIQYQRELIEELEAQVAVLALGPEATYVPSGEVEKPSTDGEALPKKAVPKKKVKATIKSGKLTKLTPVPSEDEDYDALMDDEDL